MRRFTRIPNQDVTRPVGQVGVRVPVDPALACLVDTDMVQRVLSARRCAPGG